MRKYVITIAAAAAAAAAMFSFPATAQDQRHQEGWGFSIGSGIMASPTYLGDDDYQVSAVPSIRVTYEDKLFASVQEGAGYNVINNEDWRIGPLVHYDFGRDEDGDSVFRVGGDDTNDLRGLGDVDGTVEIGGFIEYKLKPVSVKLQLLQGIGGHEGLHGEVSLPYSGRTTIMNKHAMYSFGPDIKFADSNYHDAYFSVNANQSSASGLAQYKADLGILSYGFGGSVIVPMTDKVSTILFVNYSMLGDEAADSSLVEQRGSDNQGSLGVFVNYSF
jgi:outer membrane protein